MGSAAIGLLRRLLLLVFLFGEPERDRAIVSRVASELLFALLLGRGKFEGMVVARNSRAILTAQELEVAEQIMTLRAQRQRDVSAPHDLLHHRECAGDFSAALREQGRIVLFRARILSKARAV